jgi:hypothetical protein
MRHREEFQSAGRGLSSALIAGGIIWAWIICAALKVWGGK